MAARVKVGGVERAGRDGLRPPGAWPVAAVAGAIVAVLMVVSWRYGYHRDELYYLQQSAHLAWGSVDSGPLVIAIARAADACCHGALPALRFLLMNPVTAPVWLSGLVRLWRDPERGPYRAVAVAFVVLAPTIAVLIGDRPYSWPRCTRRCSRRERWRLSGG